MKRCNMKERERGIGFAWRGCLGLVKRGKGEGGGGEKGFLLNMFFYFYFYFFI